MKCMNESYMMVYAIGALDYATKDESNATIELGDIHDDFKGYVLSKGKTGSNDIYGVYYRGNFGKDTNFSQLIGVRDGWKMNHLVALLMDAIKMHKAEMKNKKKT